ncbi:hypothetical protein DFQ28_006048 [Apophysomyces sp. BC1034]|nr:hypothetical protein DFQ28_006048 [Apophysomyces sp. BC1034]
MIDYTNLYIKNLDLTVKSSDLFNYFRKYGRIISARVMTNSETKISKGFGFVSFSKSEEAYRALKEMNRQCINSKPIIVAFHEPKKPRTDKPYHPPQPQPPVIDFLANDSPYCFNNSNRPPQPPPLPDLVHTYPGATPGNAGYMHVAQPPHPPPPPPMPSLPPQTVFFGQHHPYHDNVFSARSPLPLVGHCMADQFSSLNDKVGISHLPLCPQRTVANNNFEKIHQANLPIKPSSHSLTTTPMLPSSACYTPSLASLASGACINTSPPQPPLIPEPRCEAIPTERPMLRRRGSMESMSSIMSEATSHIQRQRIREAVMKCGEAAHLDDIVDMILTLKRKERSLCLFNPIFLRTKIDLAKGALEAFQEDHGDNNHQPPHSPSLIVPSPLPSPQHTQKESTHQSVFKHSPEPLLVTPPSTVSSSQKLTEQSSLSTSSSTASTGELDDISTLLASMENLTTIEKKQKLGDRLFPCVKATGVKHAPKVTIRLLDTVPLEELAFSMRDKEVLKSKVDAVAISLK